MESHGLCDLSKLCPSKEYLKIFNLYTQKLHAFQQGDISILDRFHLEKYQGQFRHLQAIAPLTAFVLELKFIEVLLNLHPSIYRYCRA